MVLAYNPNVNGGLASGVEKLANAYIERGRRKGIASGLEQINSGDWESGLNTIAQKSPDTALGLMQYKQKADDAFALEQMKEQARNTMTPYQQEMLNIQKQKLAQGGNGTGSIQNIEYLVKQGYTPEQAANMVFSGQNPNVAGLGEKGQAKYEENLGKEYAEDVNQLRNLESNLPALQQMVGELKGLAKEGTYTKAGKLFDVAQTQLFGRATKGDVASSTYETKVNQNLLPLLKQTFGSAFTEKDRESLQKTLGDPNSHPTIKAQALDSFIQNKVREIESKRRKVQSYSQQPIQNEEVIDFSDL